MRGNIEKSNVEDIVELSAIQKGMLFHYLREPDNNIYNVQLSFDLQGNVDLSALKAAFLRVQSKNEALRSVFRWKEIKNPVQLILKSCPVEVNIFDGEATEIAHEEWAARFDLEQLPVRVSVVKLERDRFQLNITHHHILYDGWSSGILIRELFQSYNDLLAGAGPSLPKLTYREIRRGQTAPGDSGEGSGYWKDYLAGYEPVALFPGVSGDEGAVARLKMSFPARPLEVFAWKNNVTKAAVVYAAYGILLQKYFNVDDLMFGISVSSRDMAVKGMENVIGNYVNTIPLRFRRDDSQTLLDVVVKTNKDLIHGNQYSRIPLQKVKEMLMIPAQQHVFDTVVGVKNYPVDKDIFHSLTDIQVSLASYSEHTNVPLTLSVFTGEELTVELSYKQKVVSAAMAIELKRYFSRIFHEILSRSAVAAGDIGLLSEREEEKMLKLAVSPGRAPSAQSVTAKFKEQAESTPDNIAVVFEDRLLTYRELDQKSDLVAATLIREGVNSGEVVGLMVNPSLELITGLIGIIKAGAAFLPMNPELPKNRLEFMRSDADCRLVLSESDINKMTEGTVQALPEVAADALLYIIYTSGTTGNPKGVMITHGNMVNYTGWAADFLGLRGSDRWCLTQSFSFDGSYTAIFGSLLTGASLHVLAKNDYVNAAVFFDYVVKNSISHVKFTPSLYAAYVDHPDLIRLCSLKILMFGGEKIKPEQVQKTMEVLADTRVVNQYGPTETTVAAIAGFIEREGLADFKKTPFAGRPVANVACYVLGNDGNILPAGVKGELYIGGKGVAMGYLNQPELTQRKFIADPYSDGGRLYRTGDWATFLPNGNLQIFGRIDNQIKIRGQRTELGEIEGCLLAHPLVNNAIVIAKGDEQHTYLVGYFMAAETLDKGILEAHLLRELPEFMVPRMWVQLHEIPVTANGKLDKTALPDAVRAADGVDLPATAIEKRLSAIFAEVLHMRAADIGITQSFFELGGHSLNAISLTNRIYKELNAELLLSDIFNQPSIRALAELIDKNQPAVYTGLEVAADKPCYELSSAQKRLFILHQLDPASLAYNMPYVVELEGEVDPDRIRQTFNELIERHESLRTSFVLLDGRPVQRIEKHARLEWCYGVRAFDLSRAPLIRAGVMESEGRTYLMVDMHHIITDGKSHGVLIRDFAALYSGQSLPPIPFQYKDYTEWQQRPDFQRKIARQREFWIDQFIEECPVMNLPTDFARSRINTHQGGAVHFEWSHEQSRAVRELAQGTGSVFMTLLSFFYILIGKLSNLDDVTVGTPVAGRQHPDLEGIIGMFVNTIPLRVFPKGDKAYTDFLTEVRAAVLGGMDNQDYPYETLVEELKVSGDTSRNALFNTVFVFDDFEGNELMIPGLRLKRCEVAGVTSKFDLMLVAKEVDGRFTFHLEYDANLFKRTSVERFAGYFNRIAGAILNRKDISLAAIDMLTEGEKRQLQEDLDRSEVGFPRHKTIVDLFNEQALKAPDRIALTYGNKNLDYAELGRRSDLVANYLRRAGVRQNSVVGLFMERSIETITGILGILKAGGAYLPLDAGYAAERINYMVEDSGARWVLTTGGAEHGHITGAAILQIEHAQEQEADRLPGVSLTPADLAYIIYTSGTTGKPKGVMVEHRNVVRLLFNDAFQFDFSSDDVWTMFHGPSFDFSVWEIFGALLYGSRLVIIPRAIARDSRAFLEVMRKEEVTILNQTPRAFYNLIQEDADSASRLHKLRMVIFGGEALAPARLKGWQEKYGQVKLINMFGITETTVHVTYKEIGRHEIDNNISNIGRPIPTLSAYVLDDHLNLLPRGVTGELYVGGMGVARGYINNEKLTKERFVDNPFKPGERLYRSGDHVKMLDGGDLQYSGRIDNQIKLRGFRIELAEIERALGGHVPVRDVVVIDLKRNEVTSLVAYYVADRRIDPAELREFLSRKLPDYMIPTFFVQVDVFPLTPNGKLNKRALPGLPSETIASESRPQSAIQKELIGIWSEILELDRDKIGIHTNFFELGGNSLSVVRMASKIEKVFGVTIGVANIFAYPMISLLAEFLDGDAGKELIDEGSDKEDDIDPMSHTLGILRQQQA